MRATTTTAAGPVGYRCRVAPSRPRKSNHSHTKWRDCRGPVIPYGEDYGPWKPGFSVRKSGPSVSAGLVHWWRFF
jgi:hypothetical protein